MWDWFKLFNLDEFLSEELTSRTLVAVLEGRGTAIILISRGNMVSLTYNDVYLPVNLVGINPYIDSGYGSFIDTDNNVWLGFEVES